MQDNYCSGLSEKWCKICLKNLFTSIKNSNGNYLYNKILTQHSVQGPWQSKVVPTFPTSLPVPSFPHILQSSHMRLCTISSICYVHSYCHIFTDTLFVTSAQTTLNKHLLILQGPGLKKVLSVKSSLTPSLSRQKCIMLSSRLSHHIIHTTNVVFSIPSARMAELKPVIKK